MISNRTIEHQRIKNIIMLTILRTFLCLVLFFVAMLRANADQPHPTVKTKIAIKLSRQVKADSLQLFVFGHSYVEGLPTIAQSDVLIITEPVVNGLCHFLLDLEATPHYYLVKENRGSLIESEHRIIDKNIITGGDDIHIQIDDVGIGFSGRGARKMTMFNELPTWSNHMRDSVSRELNIPTYSNKELGFVYHYFERSKQLSKLWIKTMIAERELYADAEYQFLLVEGVGYIQYSPIFVTGIKALINKSFNSDEMIQILNVMEHSLIDLRGQIVDSILAQSDNWIKFVNSWVDLSQKLRTGNSFSKYEYLKQHYSGSIRDKLITRYLISTSKHIADVDSLSQDFMGIIQNEYYKNLISQSVSSRRKGEKAKDFSLLDQYGNSVKLSDFYGKVVFLDFWFPGCIPCVRYFDETISYAEESFKNNLDVVFLSVCIKGGKEKWLDALKTNKYSSPRAINLFTGEAEWNHPIIIDYAITSAPTPILIDRNGRFFSTNSNELGRGDKENLIDTISKCLEQ